MASITVCSALTGKLVSRVARTLPPGQKQSQHHISTGKLPDHFLPADKQGWGVLSLKFFLLSHLIPSTVGDTQMCVATHNGRDSTVAKTRKPNSGPKCTGHAEWLRDLGKVRSSQGLSLLIHEVKAGPFASWMVVGRQRDCVQTEEAWDNIDVAGGESSSPSTK